MSIGRQEQYEISVADPDVGATLTDYPVYMDRDTLICRITDRLGFYYGRQNREDLADQVERMDPLVRGNFERWLSGEGGIPEDVSVADYVGSRMDNIRVDRLMASTTRVQRQVILGNMSPRVLSRNGYNIALSFMIVDKIVRLLVERDEDQLGLNLEYVRRMIESDRPDLFVG